MGKQLGLVDDMEDEENKSLVDRFVVPPFSILDARQGYWQKRKREWQQLGIKSEIGRDKESLKANPEDNDSDALRRQADKRSNLNDAPDKPDWATETGTEKMAPGTSIFDPVLTEVIYKWFNPQGGKILDPFAGGSVRGVVAGKLGYPYKGIELRSEQVEANRRQADIADKVKPEWLVGDSNQVLDKIDNWQYDLVFSCPPYYDLEVYSQEEGELSAKETYSEFRKSYKKIIHKSLKKLKNNRFACFVVQNIRDDDGFYHDLVGDTVKFFESGGMRLYNEAMLITALGSLAIRVGRQFGSMRKLGKTHQNVLIFYKGDPEKIKENYDIDNNNLQRVMRKVR